jgi:hypothetical protein
MPDFDGVRAVTSSAGQKSGRSGAVAPPSSRDHRIDFWRGLALLTIFVNHVPGNVFEHLTHRNFGISDSAELFVFLAGFSAAVAYFPKFLSGDRLVATGRVVQRTWSLYLAHVVLILAAVAMFFAAAIHFKDAHWLEAYGLDVLSTEPIRGYIGLVTLGHQIGYFNILPLYVALFALLPAILWLATRNVWLPLAASVALYLVSHLADVRLPTYPTDFPWFFEPLRWQLLFTIGFVAGVFYRSGRPVGFNPVAYGAALAVLIAGAAVALFGLYPQPGMLPLPEFLWSLDKSSMPLPRLLHVLALVYVVAHFPYGVFDRLVERLGPNAAPTRIGRHGLALFCFGSLAAVLGQIVVRASGGDPWIAAAFVATGVLAHVVYAAGLDAWRARVAAARTGRPAAGAPAHATAGKASAPAGAVTA